MIYKIEFEEQAFDKFSKLDGSVKNIAEIQDDKFIVLMLAIAHRRKVYKTASIRLN